MLLQQSSKGSPRVRDLLSRPASMEFFLSILCTDQYPSTKQVNLLSLREALSPRCLLADCVVRTLALLLHECAGILARHSTVRIATQFGCSAGLSGPDRNQSSPSVRNCLKQIASLCQPNLNCPLAVSKRLILKPSSGEARDIDASHLPKSSNAREVCRDISIGVN